LPTKSRCQTLTPCSNGLEAFVELGVVAVVGIEEVEFASGFDEVAQEEHLGRRIGQSFLHFVNVLTCHSDHDVLAVQVAPVGVGRE
jgi:hypothetical protein